MTLLIPARTTLQSMPPQEQQQQLSSTEKAIVLVQDEAVSIDTTTTTTRRETKTNDDDDDDDDDNAIILQQELEPEKLYCYYESKKPTWWKNVARKKATKGQRRIIQNLQSSHIIQKPKQYGTFINWETVLVESTTNTTANKAEAMTIPIIPQEQNFEIWYEIGFGTGDNLLYLAQQSEEKEHLQQQQQVPVEQTESDHVRILVNSKNNNNDEIDKTEQTVQETTTTILTPTPTPPAASKFVKNNNENKRRYYIGSEMYQSGVGTILSRIYNNGIIKNQYYTDYQLYSSTTNNTSSNNNNNNNSNECDTNALADPNKTTSEKNVSATIVSDNATTGIEDGLMYSNDYNDNEYDESIIQSATTGIVSNNTRDDPLLFKKYTNIKVYNGDGVRLLSYIPRSTIHVIMINFPDPFPRKKEQQWRIVQVSTLIQIYRTLYKNNNSNTTDSDENINNTNTTPGRFFLATDHYGYYQWVVIEQIDKVNNEIQRLQHEQEQQLFQSTTATPISNCENYNYQFVPVVPCPDRSLWLPVSSKYEQKGYNEGRTCTYTACWEIK